MAGGVDADVGLCLWLTGSNGWKSGNLTTCADWYNNKLGRYFGTRERGGYGQIPTNSVIKNIAAANHIVSKKYGFISSNVKTFNNSAFTNSPPLANMVAGTYDNFIRQDAADVKAVNGTVYIELWSELNVGQCPPANQPSTSDGPWPQPVVTHDKGSGCGAGATTAAKNLMRDWCKKYVDIFDQEGVTNARFVTSMAIGGSYGPAAAIFIEPLLALNRPGHGVGGYVDVIALDTYNHAGQTDSPATMYDSGRIYAKSKGKPFGIFETGTHQGTGPTGAAFKAQWYTDCGAYATRYKDDMEVWVFTLSEDFYPPEYYIEPRASTPVVNAVWDGGTNRGTITTNGAHGMQAGQDVITSGITYTNPGGGNWNAQRIIISETPGRDATQTLSKINGTIVIGIAANPGVYASGGIVSADNGYTSPSWLTFLAMTQLPVFNVSSISGAVTAASTLSATGVATQFGAGAVTAVSALSGTGLGSATIGGAGALNSTSVLSATGSSDLVQPSTQYGNAIYGTSVYGVTGSPTNTNGSGTLTGASALSAAGVMTGVGSGSVSGASTLSASGAATSFGSGTMEGTSVLSATVVGALQGQGTVYAYSDVSAVGVATVFGSGVLTAASALHVANLPNRGKVRGKVQRPDSVEASAQRPGRVKGSTSLA